MAIKFDASIDCLNVNSMEGFGSTNPDTGFRAAVGSSAKVSRDDHIHPRQDIYEFNGARATANTGTDFYLPRGIGTNTGPFVHSISAGSLGTSAVSVTNIMQSGGKVMMAAGKCKEWRGWTSANKDLSNFKLALIKYTPVDSSNTAVAGTIIKEFSFTSAGNQKGLRFHAAIETEDEYDFVAGDILLTAIKGVSAMSVYFTSTLLVKY